VTTSVADFNAGTLDAGAYISRTNNGEVILAPTIGAEFRGTSLPAGWSSTALAAGGTSTVGSNVVTVDGAALLGGNGSLYGPGRSIEFTASFTGAAGQYAGFATAGNVTQPFAMFGTKASGTLLASSFVSGTPTTTAIAGTMFSGAHKFRIDWNATTIVYWVDDKKVATHTISISQMMQPAALDLTVGDGALAVSYMRMTPYAAVGNYTSAVFDAGGAVNWLTANWTAVIPAGTNVVVQYRTGSTPTPGATWTPYTTVPTSGAALTGSSRYFQFTVQETTTNTAQTPVVKDVTLAFSR